MKNHKNKKGQRAERKAFLRGKRETASLTDRLLLSSVGTEASVLVVRVRDRTGGRARKTRRG